MTVRPRIGSRSIPSRILRRYESPSDEKWMRRRASGTIDRTDRLTMSISRTETWTNVSRYQPSGRMLSSTNP